MNVSDTGTYYKACTCSACMSMGENKPLSPLQNVTGHQILGSKDAGEDLLVTQWTGTGASNLNYKFLTSVPTYYSSFDQERTNFQPFTNSMQSATETILDQIETFTNLQFTKTNNENDYGTITFAQASLPLNTGAWAYYPSYHPKGGDVWTNNIYSNTQDMTVGEYGYYTIMHEVGHALGLQHSFDAFDGQQATSQYSVMAYDWSPYFSVSYMVYDIAALQKAYGTNTSYRTGDDNYELSSNYAYTIWDAGGDDTFDVSSKVIDTVLDLREGAYSTVGLLNNIGIAYGAIIENAQGGSGDDTIIGNQANNILHGNAGDDTFYSSDGDDYIDGGSGNDEIIYDLSKDNFIISLIDYTTVTLKNISNDFIDTFMDIESVTFNNVVYNVFSNTNNNYQNLFDIVGTSEDDILDGTAGADYLYGFAGFDTLTGSAGDDVLYGGLGDDVYHYSLGDGFDIIDDEGGVDTLRFINGFNEDNIIQQRIGDDLEITFTNSGTDKISVRNHYASADNTIENFVYGTDFIPEDSHSLLYFGSDSSVAGDGALNASLIDAIPVLNGSNSNAEGTISSSGNYSSSFQPWNVADGTTEGRAWLSPRTEEAWLSFDFAEDTVINKYMIGARDASSAATSPRDWMFEGSDDGVNWTTLDSVSGESGWSSGEMRYYDFVNTQAYDQYRIFFTSNNGGVFYTIGEIDFIEAQGGPAGQLLFDGITLTDDSPDVQISEMELRLSGHHDGIGSEILSASSVPGITASYTQDNVTGDYVLSLNGLSSVSDYQQILQSIIYRNDAADKTNGLRQIDVSIKDASGNESNYSVDIQIGPDGSALALSSLDYIALEADVAIGPQGDGSLNTSLVDAIPVLNGSNSSAEGTISSSGNYSSSFQPWNVADGTTEGRAWLSPRTEEAWLSFDFAEDKVINKYMIGARDASSAATSPRDWMFEGSDDGVNWTTLDSVSGESGWSPGEMRYYDFVNTQAYDQYRIFFTSNNGGVFYTIGEIDFIEAQDGASLTELAIFEDLTLSGAPDDVLSQVQVRMQSASYDIDEEVLATTQQGDVEIAYTQQGDYFVLSLSGQATQAVYEDILQNVIYKNSAETLSGTRDIEIITFDENNTRDQSFTRTLDLYTQEIKGTAGSDTLTGSAGDDVLYGLDGLDTLTGNDGADIFAMKADGAFNNIDQISDFDPSEGDKLDVSDLLHGYDPLSDAITDFVQITDNGTDSFLSVDSDGGADNFVQIIQINNVIDLTDEQALETNGSLITT